MRFATYMTAVACVGIHPYVHPGYPQQFTEYILLEGDSSCHVTCPIRDAHIEYRFTAIVLSQRICLWLVSSATTAAYWIVLRTTLRDPPPYIHTEQTPSSFPTCLWQFNGQVAWLALARAHILAYGRKPDSMILSGLIP